jgi:hypothetical protein
MVIMKRLKNQWFGWSIIYWEVCMRMLK